MRGLLTLVIIIALAACGGVASGTEAAGRYRANWDQREELVLNPDYTFRRVRSDGTSASGTWSLDTSTGDTRVEMRTEGEQGVSAPSISRRPAGDIVITMSYDENRVFVKVD